MSQQKVLEARRRADDKARAMEQTLVEQDIILQKANFEKQTTAKIESRLRSNRLEALRNAKDVELYSRRRELADLYNDEISLWRNEVINSGETVAERKERCVTCCIGIATCRNMSSRHPPHPPPPPLRSLRPMTYTYLIYQNND